MSIPFHRSPVRWVIVALIASLAAGLLGGAAGFSASTAHAQGDPWTAEYYTNINLAGAPQTTVQVPWPSFGWSDQPPVAGVGADNYSVRYTSVQTLNMGLYEVSARADDGVRVYVNGQLVINQWTIATGVTYTHRFNVPTGQHVFVVEYFENNGVALLDFRLNPVSNPPQPTNATATVLSYGLNVRSAPSVTTGAILTQIRRGQTVPIIGRNAATTWWQVVANGVTGWVSAPYVAAANAHNVPVTEPGSPPPPPATYTLTANVNLNIRSGPGLGYQVVGWLPINQSAQITGRDAAARWFQVSTARASGWVSGPYTTLAPGTDINQIPVVGSTPPPAPPTVYTAVARVNLNIRSGPGTGYPVVGWLPIFQTAQIIGRNGAATWWQVTTGRYSGWVSAYYAPLQGSADVNRIPITG